MRRLLWMDRLRGAAILAVVLLHAELQASGVTGEDLPVVHEVNHLLAPARMPLLVLLSGMLLTPALTKGPRRYLAGKARTLLWPYLVWSTIDVVHLQLRLASGGGSLSPEWVLRVLWAPPTYLWFLAYLLVYYVAALGLPGRVRVAGGPVLLALAAALVASDLPGARLVWLFGWFLVGDTVGRLARGRLRAVPVPRHDLVGAVGRNSLVFYVSHLAVAILVTDRLVGAGLTDHWVVFTACVLVPLGVGVLLVRGRRHPAVDLLFAWPRAASGGAPAVRRILARDPDDRRARPAGGRA